MLVNVFEGARRIVRVVQAAFFAGFVIFGGYFVVDTGFNWFKEWDVILVVFCGTIGVEIFSRLAGWVVRGFMGIKSGKDMRDSSTKTSKE